MRNDAIGFILLLFCGTAVNLANNPTNTSARSSHPSQGSLCPYSARIRSLSSIPWLLVVECERVSERRLLLTNHDLGIPVPAKELQLGLDFSAKLLELFEGTEMGEDALRVLNDYLRLYTRIRGDVKTELPHVRAAATWASRLR